MAPVKRHLEQECSSEDNLISGKRLRGGNGPPEETDYFLDDVEDEMLAMEPPEEMEEAPVQNNVFSDITPEMRERWLRPASQVKDNSTDVNFQCFDMDMISGQPLPKNPNESKSRVVGATTGQVPVIRAYGVSEHGNSVAVFIHGYTPYGYFALPNGATFENTEDNLTKIRLLLNKRLEGEARGPSLAEYCRAVSYVTSHKSIMGYDSPHKSFFRVTVAMPTLIPTLKRIMESGLELYGVSTQGDNTYHPFECNHGPGTREHGHLCSDRLVSH